MSSTCHCSTVAPVRIIRRQLPIRNRRVGGAMPIIGTSIAVKEALRNPDNSDFAAMCCNGEISQTVEQSVLFEGCKFLSVWCLTVKSGFVGVLQGFLEFGCVFSCVSFARTRRCIAASSLSKLRAAVVRKMKLLGILDD